MASRRSSVDAMQQQAITIPDEKCRELGLPLESKVLCWLSRRTGDGWVIDLASPLFGHLVYNRKQGMVKEPNPDEGGRSQILQWSNDHTRVFFGLDTAATGLLLHAAQNLLEQATREDQAEMLAAFQLLLGQWSLLDPEERGLLSRQYEVVRGELEFEYWRVRNWVLVQVRDLIQAATLIDRRGVTNPGKTMAQLQAGKARMSTRSSVLQELFGIGLARQRRLASLAKSHDVTISALVGILVNGESYPGMLRQNLSGLREKLYLSPWTFLGHVAEHLANVVKPEWDEQTRFKLLEAVAFEGSVGWLRAPFARIRAYSNAQIRDQLEVIQLEVLDRLAYLQGFDTIEPYTALIAELAVLAERLGTLLWTAEVTEVRQLAVTFLYQLRYRQGPDGLPTADWQYTQVYGDKRGLGQFS